MSEIIPTPPDAALTGIRLRNRNGGIDALRGVSILLVLFNHIGIRLPLSKTVMAAFIPVTLLRDLNYNGYEAVFVFFVISGFLITRRSQERWSSLAAMPAVKFYAMRASRIVPCLLLVVSILSLFHWLGVPGFVIEKEGQSLGGATASAFGLYLNWYEGVHGYLPGGWDVLWSLSIEEVFYLAFPLVCLSLGRTRALVPVLALLALSLPFTHAQLMQQQNEIWMEKAYLPGMAAIAIGVLSALLAARVGSVSRRAAIALCAIGIAGLLAVVFAGTQIWALVHDSYLLILTGAAACMVLGAHWLGDYSQAPMRGLGWLRSCGRLSYEIYLFHMFAVLAVVGIARASGLGADWAFVWYVPAIALAWLLGWIVARGFSIPVERNLRRYVAEKPESMRGDADSTVSP